MKALQRYGFNASEFATVTQVPRSGCESNAFAPPSHWRGSVVERRSLAGELSLSCARSAADG